MKLMKEQTFIGERALFKETALQIQDSIFMDGESPLKEGRNIKLQNSIFKWKYPLWYCKNIEASHTTLLESARSGIWYSDNVVFEDSVIEAPKTFRRSTFISLKNVYMPNAIETLWDCQHVVLRNVQAKGDYFAMHSRDIDIRDFTLSGNYAFDGAKHVTIQNAHLNAKDAFWNCEDVVVKDSIIIGEYVGWNSKDITFINCTIQSLQGLCYMENVALENCKLINTELAFEYSSGVADIQSDIVSIKNPNRMELTANHIHKVMIDPKDCDLNDIIIHQRETAHAL